ncbi:MAG: histidinol-phosphatase [Pseudomonadota bacterium]|nr:histidinol-phosphatase [Pseudomonadota bacterium]
MSTPAELLQFAYRTAVAAGHVILPHFRESIAIDDKGPKGAYDPVTEADRAAEHVIRAAITGAYPDHGLRGEEHGAQAGASRHTWVIDPIDGTRSFIIGQLHWATLIAVNDGERVVAGVAHQPYVGESFMAGVDSPARWRRGTDERVMRTRRCLSIGEAVVACTDPKMFAQAHELEAFQRVATQARLVRYGGDCYAYCLLAMGLIDVVIESSLRAWDVQALMPIVERAGGVITTWNGEGCEEGGAVVATGDPALHERVLSTLRA